MAVVSVAGSEAGAVRVAAALERSSEPPLATALLAAAAQRAIEIPPVLDFQSVPGKGITGKVDNLSAALGTGIGRRHV